jgi:hypothetical protein
VGGDHIKGFHDPVQRLTRHSPEAVMENTSSNKWRMCIRDAKQSPPWRSWFLSEQCALMLFSA